MTRPLGTDRTARYDPELYTPGGLLVYAGLLPVIVVVAAAPAASATFVFGILTARIASAIHSTLHGPEAASQDRSPSDAVGDSAGR